MVPTGALHKKPYLCNGTALIEATEDVIRKNGDKSHKAKKQETNTKDKRDETRSENMSGAGPSGG